MRQETVVFYRRAIQDFRYPKVGNTKADPTALRADESVPAHPELGDDHPLVVFGDHRFCAGESSRVSRMRRPHMHSQIELNFVLDGAMAYWFDGRRLTVSADRLVLFWGMIPHQVIDVSEPTHFVCLYVPMSVFLGLPSLSRFRDGVFRGAMIEALEIRPFDRDVFLRWREELLSGDKGLEAIVKDELTARVRRLDREGWRDLRDHGIAMAGTKTCDADRILHIERMARFIGEHALEDITVDDVAASVGLHPNYAMTLYKRGAGMSINQAIVRHRLDTAQSLLIATDMAVTAVAFESGFGSLSRFYEAFQKRFRTKPAAFRKNFESTRAAGGSTSGAVAV